VATIKRHGPAYLWAQLSAMEKVIWASVYAHAVGSASVRARKADQTVRTLNALEQGREGGAGPEYDLARSDVMLELPEFEAWYRVQLPVSLQHVHRTRSSVPKLLSATAEDWVTFIEATRNNWSPLRLLSAWVRLSTNRRPRQGGLWNKVRPGVR